MPRGPSLAARRDRRFTRRDRGFTYLGLLLVVALMGLALAAAAEVWSTVALRHRRAELEWVGNQYAQAIGSYYESSPGTAKQYPPGIDDLLEDRRFLVIRRHLRRAYLNPLSGKNDWALWPAPAGGIRGVSAPAAPGEAARSRESPPKVFAYVPAP